jgi:hypothetical protein
LIQRGLIVIRRTSSQEPDALDAVVKAIINAMGLRPDAVNFVS